MIGVSTVDSERLRTAQLILPETVLYRAAQTSLHERFSTSPTRQNLYVPDALAAEMRTLRRVGQGVSSLTRSFALTRAFVDLTRKRLIEEAKPNGVVVAGRHIDPDASLSDYQSEKDERFNIYVPKWEIDVLKLIAQSRGHRFGSYVKVAVAFGVTSAKISQEAGKDPSWLDISIGDNNFCVMV